MKTTTDIRAEWMQGKESSDLRQMAQRQSWSASWLMAEAFEAGVRAGIGAANDEIKKVLEGAK